MKCLFFLASVFLPIVLLSAAGPVQQPPPRPGLIPARQPSGSALPSGVASDWWSQVQASIQKEEYAITWQDDALLPDLKEAYQAPNRAHGFQTYFTNEGFRVVPRTEEASWTWGLALVEQAAGVRRQKEQHQSRGSMCRRIGSSSTMAGSRSGM